MCSCKECKRQCGSRKTRSTRQIVYVNQGNTQLGITVEAKLAIKPLEVKSGEVAQCQASFSFDGEVRDVSATVHVLHGEPGRSPLIPLDYLYAPFVVPHTTSPFAFVVRPDNTYGALLLLVRFWQFNAEIGSVLGGVRVNL